MIPTFGGDNDILYSCHLGRWYLYSWEILIFSRWWIYGACCLAMIAYHKFFFSFTLRLSIMLSCSCGYINQKISLSFLSEDNVGESSIGPAMYAVE